MRNWKIVPRGDCCARSCIFWKLTRKPDLNATFQRSSCPQPIFVLNSRRDHENRTQLWSSLTPHETASRRHPILPYPPPPVVTIISLDQFPRKRAFLRLPLPINSLNWIAKPSNGILGNQTFRKCLSAPLGRPRAHLSSSRLAMANILRIAQRTYLCPRLCILRRCHHLLLQCTPLCPLPEQ